MKRLGFVNYRRPNPRENARMKKLGADLLAEAARIFDASADLDTAVRDEIAQGLGYLVHSAYDSIACGMNIADTTSWMAFIDNATAEWFRQRGFAEWFCLAAATGFRSSRPRTLVENRVKIIRRPVRKKAAA